MRWWLVMVIVLVAAGCKGKRKPPTGEGSAASSAVDVVVHELARVPATAPLAAETARIPANVLLLDSANHFALTDKPKTLDALVLHARTSSPGTIQDLVDLAHDVHSKMKDRDDERRAAERAKEEAEHPVEPGTIVDYEEGSLSPIMFAQRAPSTIDSAGDGAPVVDGVPVRVARMTAVADDKYASEPFLFVAARDARAHMLVEGLDATSGGLLAVATGQGTRALAWRFKKIQPRYSWEGNEPWRPWIELRVTAQGVDVEAVPATPTHVPLAPDGRVDAKAVQAAVYAARANPKEVASDNTLDVLVDDQASVQMLVDALTSVDAHEIGLGLTPTAAQGDAMRGKPLTLLPIPVIEMESWKGDWPDIRKLIAPHMTEIRACFAAEPNPAPVEIVAVEAKANHTKVTLAGKPTKLATCVLAPLAAPFAAQPRAFTLRFELHPPT